jgi:transposase
LTYTTIVGLYLAKNVCQVHGIDAEGKKTFNKKLRREEVKKFFESLPLLHCGDGGRKCLPLLGSRDRRLGSLADPLKALAHVRYIGKQCFRSLLSQR